MTLQSYNEWILLYNEKIEVVWNEKRESRKLEMLFCAFELEVTRIRDKLKSELSEIKADEKRNQFKEKCKKFKGLVQSEKFSDIKTMDMNEPTSDNPLYHGTENLALTDGFEPNIPCKRSSPTLPFNHSHSSKRKISPQLNIKTCKINREPSRPKLQTTLNDSDILESSIISDTPTPKPDKRSKSFKPIKKSKMAKKAQNSTLTQMFMRPLEFNRKIDSNISMSVTKMLDVINDSNSDDDQSDATIDLEIPSQDSPKKRPLKEQQNSPEFAYKEVVRGREKLNLPGWSCKECQEYYQHMNLSPNTLQKKKDMCSKHRSRFKPREDTLEGFWDLTIKTTQASESIRFDDFKKT